MKSFLKDLAETFYDAHGFALKDFCFVTPNKRSGAFLQNYFAKRFEQEADSENEAFVMPNIVTITDFVGDLCGLVVNSRIDSLFTLYSLYTAMDGVDIDFDRFRIWGDIALNDFNDVDMFCADARKLFINLRNLNEIATDYLTDEQREVIDTYFPDSAKRPGSESFWQHFNNESLAGNKYIQLWQLMYELYSQLNASLEARGLCMSGRAYRRALEEIESKGLRVLPYKQVVFVGFNALTTVEYRIFRAIGRIKVELDGELTTLGDYYWDAAGEVLQGKKHAAHFMYKNRKNFPSKHKLTQSSLTTGFPKRTKIVACPGNTIQTKVVAELLDEIVEKDPTVLTSPESLVVAMPDENLFFPMLYSLPFNLKEVNITMGYPLKITSTYSWMRLFKTLHAHSRMDLQGVIFLRQDIEPFIVHPMTRALLGSHICQWISESINNQHSFTVSEADLLSFIRCENLNHKPVEKKKKLEQLEAVKTPFTDKGIDLLFTPLSQLPDTQSLCHRLISLLQLTVESLRYSRDHDVNSTFVKTPIEIENLFTYMDAVRRFMDSVLLHRIEMNHSSAFSLINQLLAGERTTFSGEPLTGVQIMGMLETRSLDFRNVIITSMNEKVYPRRLHKRSFIPNSIRFDYGLSTTRFQESIFAYYFYRMISRAENLYLLYDSRSGGLRSGDPSRYIYQLRNIYSDKTELENQTRRITIAAGERSKIEGEKTPEVMEKLKGFLQKGSGQKLSASSLKAYFKCPLKFYFEYVKGIKIKEEKIEAMTSAQIGTIFHDTMDQLYKSELKEDGKPALITKATIENWLKKPNDNSLSKAEQLLKNNILKEYLNCTDTDVDLQGYSEIYFDPIYLYVKSMLESDMRKTPFEYIGGEYKEQQTFPLNDGTGREVNMTYIIDRVDRVNGRIRLIDYKTGLDPIEAKDIDDIFASKHAILQLLLYCSLYDLHQNNKEPLKIGIAKPDVSGESTGDFDVAFNGDILDDHTVVKRKFEERLRKELVKLFDDTTPFKPFEKKKPSDKEPCTYCNFKVLCEMKRDSSLTECREE